MVNQTMAAVTVQLRDVNGDVVTQAGVAVSLALSQGTGSLSGTLTVLTNASGQASFGNLEINSSGTKRFTVTATGLTSAISNAFLIQAAAADVVVEARVVGNRLIIRVNDPTYDHLTLSIDGGTPITLNFDENGQAIYDLSSYPMGEHTYSIVVYDADNESSNPLVGIFKVRLPYSQGHGDGFGWEMWY